MFVKDINNFGMFGKSDFIIVGMGYIISLKADPEITSTILQMGYNRTEGRCDMHPITTVKYWGHHMHDDLLRFEHAFSEHLHSRHFWVGVFAALLFIGLLTALMLWAWSVQPEMFDGFDSIYPYMYYGV